MKAEVRSNDDALRKSEIEKAKEAAEEAKQRTEGIERTTGVLLPGTGETPEIGVRSPQPPDGFDEMHEMMAKRREEMRAPIVPPPDANDATKLRYEELNRRRGAQDKAADEAVAKRDDESKKESEEQLRRLREDKSIFFVFLGNSCIGSSQFPISVFVQDGEPMLSIDRDGDGIVISAKLFSSDGDIVCEHSQEPLSSQFG